MKVEATIINPAYKKAVDQLEYDLRHYLYFDLYETRQRRMEKIHSKYAKHLTIRGEMISQDFDKFECVVLAEDGTYHKVSLDKVKVIKDDSENN
jgi:hypothetical protein